MTVSAKEREIAEGRAIPTPQPEIKNVGGVAKINGKRRITPEDRRTPFVSLK